MIRDLHVRNLAVVSGAAIELGSGLNVLTGETGAGKSIVVDSLSLLAGARASGDLIRAGSDLLSVSGLFEVGEEVRRALAEAGVDAAGGELVVRREVSREGRNRVFLNDQPVTLKLLAELASDLLRIHTQGQEIEAAQPQAQRAWLDASGGAEAEVLRRDTGRAYAEHAALAARLARLGGDERLRAERLDLLRFQTGEIDASRLVAGEDEELRGEREVLRHCEALTEALGGAVELLFDGEGAAVDALGRARQLLARAASWDGRAAEWAAAVEGLAGQVGEVARAVRGRLDGLEPDPRRLEAVEERLALLERLFRKYGATAADVLAYRTTLAREVEELEGTETTREGLEQEVTAGLGRYRRHALALSEARRGWGIELAGRVLGELADLALRRARFEVVLERRPRAGSTLAVDGQEIDFSAEGIDQVTFLFAANPGEPAGHLARIASGGELSRVFLALQLAVPDSGSRLPAMVFDEVDAGIGGAEAAALGEKLARLARRTQVVAVTHLPQVASHADRHFRVRKRVRSGRAHVEIEALDAGGRVEEIARMLAGREVTDLSRSHARELISASRR